MRGRFEAAAAQFLSPSWICQQFLQGAHRHPSSASPTTSPALSMTYGISPLSLPTTGTAQANASISIRPNCSRQAGVVWLGAQTCPWYSGMPAPDHV